MAKRPDVLLCDDPTDALDYPTGRIVLEAISTINRELGTTTVVITHNAPIAQMADRVLHLADGRIASVSARDPITTCFIRHGERPPRRLHREVPEPPR